MSHARMSERLSGRTILITGASSGIGRSTALEFARTAPKDLRLILTARREENLHALAAEIKKEVGDGVKCLCKRLDMADVGAVAGFVEELKKEGKDGEWSDIGVLVNNAGLVKGVAKSPDINPPDIETMFAVNVTGLITLTQAVMKHYKTRPEGGRGDIINIGSIAGREGYPGGSIYCATKAAVRSFTEALRKETVDSRIRVMEIDPGQVETEFSLVRFGGDEEKARKVYEGCEPLTPDDIAEIVVFAVGRRENVVVADTLVFPSHQGAATVMHRKT